MRPRALRTVQQCFAPLSTIQDPLIERRYEDTVSIEEAPQDSPPLLRPLIFCGGMG